MTSVPYCELGPTLESPFMQKPATILDTAFDLYGFLPGDDDSRWDFLARYDQIRQQTGFTRMNFHNAWGATYLSEISSYRNGYINSLTPENDLQLNRALDNLEYADEVVERYKASQESFEDIDIRLTLTDRVNNADQTPKPETPCPEALYQVRLYDPVYLARVGFNVHREDDHPVLSIVNIQGVPGGNIRNAIFESEFGVRSFNTLVRRVLSLAGVQDPQYEVRGLLNPATGNSKLYWGVLDAEKVPMYHARKKITPASYVK